MAYELSFFSKKYVLYVNKYMENASAALGKGSYYHAEFAAKGKSGLSFGVMQNDVRTNAFAREKFIYILNKEGFKNSEIDNIIKSATQQAISKQEFIKNIGVDNYNRINEALEKNKDIVDQLDTKSAQRILKSIETAIETIGERGVFNQSHPDFYQAIARMGHWSNQTGGLNEFQKYFVKMEKEPSIQDIKDYLKNQRNFDIENNHQAQDYSKWEERMEQAQKYAFDQQKLDTLDSKFLLPWEQTQDSDWKVIPSCSTDRCNFLWYDLEPFRKLTPFRYNKVYAYDPLTLDLDGDGIETTAIEGLNSTLFDHNKDGIRTATGWVSADDGLLVLDRNGDGVINHGGELFGDNTLLKDGSLAALAEFDENGDGKIDAQDAVFEQLKVWRDLNQDGISQEGELFTLAELGITSLNLAHLETNHRQGKGNTIARTGSYTDSEGKEHLMGDLLFDSNPMISRFTDKIALSAEQRQAAKLLAA